MTTPTHPTANGFNVSVRLLKGCHPFIFSVNGYCTVVLLQEVERIVSSDILRFFPDGPGCYAFLVRTSEEQRSSSWEPLELADGYMWVPPGRILEPVPRARENIDPSSEKDRWIPIVG